MEDKVIALGLERVFSALTNTNLHLGMFENINDGLTVVRAHSIANPSKLYTAFAFTTASRYAIAYSGLNGQVVVSWNHAAEDPHPRAIFSDQYNKQLISCAMEHATHQVLSLTAVGLPLIAFMETLDRHLGLALLNSWGRLITMTLPGLEVLESQLTNQYHDAIDFAREIRSAADERFREQSVSELDERTLIKNQLVASALAELQASNESRLYIADVVFGTRAQELLTNGDMDEIACRVAGKVSTKLSTYSFKVLDKDAQLPAFVTEARNALYVIFRRSN